MSALDKAVAEIEAKRAQRGSERAERREAACAFLKEFYEKDVERSRS